MASSNFFNMDNDIIKNINFYESDHSLDDTFSKNFDEQLDNLIKDSMFSNIIFEDYSDSYSVLGVNLNLSCNNNNGDMMDNSDINTFGNLDTWIEETVDSMVYKDLLNENCFDNILMGNIQDSPHENFQSDESVDILNSLPHITEEKNVKRRSLLYERSVNLDKLKKDYLSTTKQNKKHHALLTHDYTHKRNEDHKYFPCSVLNCDRVYSKSSHLKAHLKRHSGEKPFVCNWDNCTWKFSRSDELARHKRSHLGIKPYKCELCERAFARSDHLAKHHKVHKKKMAQYGNYQIKRRVS